MIYNILYFMCTMGITFYAIISALHFIKIISLFIRKRNKKVLVTNYKKSMHDENMIPISVVVPINDESVYILESIQEMMKLDYPQFEIIIVNDGYNNDNSKMILEHFKMEKIEPAIKRSLSTKKIRNIFYNFEYPNIIYAEKDKGGMQDTLNCGINISQYPLFLPLEAGSRVKCDCLSKLVMDFLKNSSTVISSGFFIYSKEEVDKFDKDKESTDKPSFKRMQVLKSVKDSVLDIFNRYLYSSMDSKTGIFGLFNKQAVIDCGGYMSDTADPYSNLIIKMQAIFMKNKRKCSFAFHKEVPCYIYPKKSFSEIWNAQKRWQFGLIDIFKKNWNVMFNGSYNRLGFIDLPFYIFFEILFPICEIVIYAMFFAFFFIGGFTWQFLILYLVLVILINSIISLGSLVINQIDNFEYTKLNLRLALWAFLENFGFRQIMIICRIVGMIRYRSYRKQLKKFNTIK